MADMIALLEESLKVSWLKPCSVKLCIEAAMLRVASISFNFVALFTKTLVPPCLPSLYTSVNDMDEKKRGVASEQST